MLVSFCMCSSVMTVGDLLVDCLFSFPVNSPGIMLLIYTKSTGHVPLKILSIEDGTVLKSFQHLINRSKKVDFIEQFNEKLLVKQENENLQILDVKSHFIFLVKILLNSFHKTIANCMLPQCTGSQLRVDSSQ